MMTEAMHSFEQSFSLSRSNEFYSPTDDAYLLETFHQLPHGDFRPTFYNPFEIKHRRRTSRSQLKVLEKAFSENPKPNATVRRILAQKLDMTPRGVQIWFQNRRAKVKLQRRKSAAKNEQPQDSLSIDTAPFSTASNHFLSDMSFASLNKSSSSSTCHSFSSFATPKALGNYSQELDWSTWQSMPPTTSNTMAQPNLTVSCHMDSSMSPWISTSLSMASVPSSLSNSTAVSSYHGDRYRSIQDASVSMADQNSCSPLISNQDFMMAQTNYMAPHWPTNLFSLEGRSTDLNVGYPCERAMSSDSDPSVTSSIKCDQISPALIRYGLPASDGPPSLPEQVPTSLPLSFYSLPLDYSTVPSTDEQLTPPLTTASCAASTVAGSPISFDGFYEQSPFCTLAVDALLQSSTL